MNPIPSPNNTNWYFSPPIFSHPCLSLSPSLHTLSLSPIPPIPRHQFFDFRAQFKGNLNALSSAPPKSPTAASQAQPPSSSSLPSLSLLLLSLLLRLRPRLLQVSINPSPSNPINPIAWGGGLRVQPSLSPSNSIQGPCILQA